MAIEEAVAVRRSSIAGGAQAAMAGAEEAGDGMELLRTEGSLWQVQGLDSAGGGGADGKADDEVPSPPPSVARVNASAEWSWGDALTAWIWCNRLAEVVKDLTALDGLHELAPLRECAAGHFDVAAQRG